MNLRAVFCKPFLHILILTVMTAGLTGSMVEADEQLSAAYELENVVIPLEEGLNLRVMTFNIRHGKGQHGFIKLKGIIDEIKQSDADIVSLQEVDRYNIRSGFKDQVSEIGKALDMHWVYAASLKFGFTQYGNAILSKHPIDSYTVTSLPGKVEKRSVLQANIVLGSQELHVVTTHLGLTAKERIEQLAILDSILKALQGPSILMGDFNMEGDDPWFTQLTQSWQKLKLKKTSGTVLSGLEIDHLFVRGSISASEAWTIETKASDHVPVVADIILE